MKSCVVKMKFLSRENVVQGEEANPGEDRVAENFHLWHIIKNKIKFKLEKNDNKKQLLS